MAEKTRANVCISQDILVGSGKVYATVYTLTFPERANATRLVEEVTGSLLYRLNKSACLKNARTSEISSDGIELELLKMTTKNESIKLCTIKIYTKRMEGDMKLVVEYSDGFNQIPTYIDMAVRGIAKVMLMDTGKNGAGSAFAPQRIIPRRWEQEMENEGGTRRSSGVPLGIRGTM